LGGKSLKSDEEVKDAVKLGMATYVYDENIEKLVTG